MKYRSIIFNSAGRITRLVSLTVLLGVPALAQETGNEFWPELNVFVKLNETSRLFLLAAGTKVKDQTYTDGSLGLHLDIFSSPIFKSRLERTARRADAARNKFLQLRIGYLYSQSAKGSSNPFHEHTPTLEVTPRFYFPNHTLVTARARGDFRIVNGVFTPRMRYRLKLEHSFQLEKTAITPYVHAEAFYDWRYDMWHRFRYTAGAEWELNRRFVLEGYYLRQRDNRSSTKYLNAVSATLQFYLR